MTFITPDPVWPVLVLAAVQFGDGLLCVKPVGFIAECFEAVRFPRRLWWLMPIIKFAAAAGLIAGLWVPYLAAVTCAALVGYFVIAIGMHVRATDLAGTCSSTPSECWRSASPPRCSCSESPTR